MGNVISFDDIRGVNGIPQIAGYRIVENFVIAAKFKTMNAHSADVYDFLLLRPDGTNERLFYGIVQGEEEVRSDPGPVSATAGAELTRALNWLAQSGIRKIARKTPNCIVKHYGKDEHIHLIACRCDQGTIIGGWHSGNGNRDIARQMLAYCMFTFAAINNVAGKKDIALLWNAHDTIPYDSRFGKFNAEEAAAIRNCEYLGREERMRLRAIRIMTEGK